MAKPKSLHPRAHVIHAMNVDKDDPFIGRRLSSHMSNRVPATADYSATRRIPAPIEERFTLIRKGH
jgi:hypothetical protein